MSNGKEFQGTDAATGNERCPTVDRRNGGTCSMNVQYFKRKGEHFQQFLRYYIAITWVTLGVYDCGTEAAGSRAGQAGQGRVGQGRVGYGKVGQCTGPYQHQLISEASDAHQKKQPVTWAGCRCAR